MMTKEEWNSQSFTIRRERDLCSLAFGFLGVCFLDLAVPSRAVRPGGGRMALLEHSLERCCFWLCLYFDGLRGNGFPNAVN